jgi:hypothetical protein
MRLVVNYGRMSRATRDGQREIVEETGVHLDVVLTRRTMESVVITTWWCFQRRCCSLPGSATGRCSWSR